MMLFLRRVLLPMFILMCLPMPVAAKPLIADLSQYRIAISSSFMGTQLILFGARQTAGDVVVVIRGPARDYTLRKKERVAGIWVNRRSLELHSIPDYYTVASTKPLDNILTPHMQQTLGIGVEHLPFITPATLEQSSLSPIAAQDFVAAFIQERKNKQLYNTSPNAVSFMGDTLFKTTLPFPDTIPRGSYTAETYLVYNGEVVGMQSTPIHVAKTGLDATIFELAHGYPVLYGILAILMASLSGWLAAVAFRKI